MRGVISSVFVLVGCFTVACLPARQVAAELPPDIMVDKYLLQAEQFIAKKSYRAAFKAINKIVALQRKHNLTLPDEFHFKYARVALSADSIKTAINLVNKYLAAAGREGEFYKEALELLNEAEMMLELEPEMVVIPAGRFRMGCVSGINCDNNEKPVHLVTIRSFELSKYEVTFEEYARFTAATGRRPASDRGWGRGRRPVIDVSWEDAVAYTEWLSAYTGKRYRLPSEAEWEYAARAGTTTKYSWGNEIGRGRANCDGCGSQWDGEEDGAGGFVRPQCLGPLRHARECVGVGAGLLERQLRGGAGGRLGLGERRLWASRVARRLVDQHGPGSLRAVNRHGRFSTGEPYVRSSVSVLPGRLPLESLRLYLMGGPGGHCPPGGFCLACGFSRQGAKGRQVRNWRAILNEESTRQPRVRSGDRSRETGPALESHFRFLAWLVPTVERFPRSQKFLLGDRIQTSALDVLERLIEATYTRRRGDALAGANLGIEKLRFLCRLARDLRYLDHRRYEHAARSLDETGRLVGGWQKVHRAEKSA